MILAPYWTKPFGNPDSDSVALGELWMAHQFYPDKISADYVEKRAQEFYKNFYGTDFTEALNKSYEQEFLQTFSVYRSSVSAAADFILVSMMMGSYHTTPGEIFRIILGKMTGETAGVDEKTVNLFWTIRFPRVMAACLAGAGLSLSGAVFQSMFKNPLASPYTLGVSNGADSALLWALSCLWVR